jgi:5'-nucleotidase
VKRILVTNDDGVHAPGLRALAQALEPLGEVTVIAPLTEQSASSHALTLHQPLRIKEIGKRILAVEGTPTDCVLLAVREFLDHTPDLVVSGINQGSNLGEDVLYSGTVSAAMEGSLLGVGSLAFSLASYKHHDFSTAAGIAAKLVSQVLEIELPPKFLINVNIPPVGAEDICGLRLTQLGSRVYNDMIIKKTDPRGRDYYWIGGSEPTWLPSPNSDFQAIEDNCISVTPLMMDLTDSQGFDALSDINLEWS